MIILGISGFDNAVRFKQSRLPGLESRAYRITQGFDSAAVPIPKRQRKAHAKADGVRLVGRLMLVLCKESRIGNALRVLQLQIGFTFFQSLLGGDQIGAVRWRGDY